MRARRCRFSVSPVIGYQLSRRVTRGHPPFDSGSHPCVTPCEEVPLFNANARDAPAFGRGFCLFSQRQDDLRLAQSGHSMMSHLMSLSGVKQTWALALHMSAFDPKRTSAFAAHIS